VPKSALNVRQTLFVREIIQESNATQAAINAGYSKKTAYSNGARFPKRDSGRNAAICFGLGYLS
jgi:phage terminase small subunit